MKRLQMSAAALSLAVGGAIHAAPRKAYLLDRDAPKLVVVDLDQPRNFREISITGNISATFYGMDFDAAGHLWVSDWSSVLFSVDPISGVSRRITPANAQNIAFTKDLAWDPVSSSLRSLLWTNNPATGQLGGRLATFSTTTGNLRGISGC